MLMRVARRPRPWPVGEVTVSLIRYARFSLKIQALVASTVGPRVARGIRFNRARFHRRKQAPRAGRYRAATNQQSLRLTGTLQEKSIAARPDLHFLTTYPPYRNQFTRWLRRLDPNQREGSDCRSQGSPGRGLRG